MGAVQTVRVVYNLASYAPELEPPDNDYFEGWASLLVLLDMQGNIRHVIGEPEGSPAMMWYQSCPNWRSDAETLFTFTLKMGNMPMLCGIRCPISGSVAVLLQQ